MATWTPIALDGGAFARTTRAVQALTEVAPVAVEGVQLDINYGIETILPVVRAPAGQTFTGAGFFLGYIYVASLGLWVRAPRADLDCSDLAGLEIAALPSLPVNSATGWFQLVPNGIGVSGGAEIITDYVCTWRRR